MKRIFQMILDHDLYAIKQLLNSNQSLVNLRSNYDDSQSIIESRQLDTSDPSKQKHFINITPLHLAVYLDQIDTCQVLLDYDATIDVKDDLHYTPLIYAAYCDCQAILVYLVEYGATVNLQDLTGRTALHWAAHEGHLTCVKYLSKPETSTLAMQDQNNKTALDLAVNRNHHDIIHYFNQIRSGAS